MQRKCQIIKDSAIGLHILQSKDCANNYNDQQFVFFAGQEVFSTSSALELLTLKLSHLFYVARKNLSTHYKFNIGWGFI